MIKKIADVLKFKLGIDRAVFWATVNKIFGVISGLSIIYFLINFLSPKEQGLWYTFVSLSALTVFAELGFTTIITQFVSHEFAKLKEENNLIKGEPMRLDRFMGFVYFAIRFFFMVIPVAIIILTTAGYFYFRGMSPIIFLAWFCFSLVAGLNLFMALLQSIYQGIDRVKEVQINTLVYSIVAILCNCIMLVLHFKIWALVLGNLVGLLVEAILFYKIAPNFWNQVIFFKIQKKYNFLKETLPLQWRYAISWSSGFLIFYLYVPAIYKFVGPVQAGQFGLTMAMVGAITSVSNGWVLTKMPRINMFVANKKRSDLDVLFKKSLLQCLAVQLILSAVLIIFVFELEKYFPNIAVRFSPMLLTVLFLAAQFAQTIINCMAIYLRAHKEEPFVWLSALNALLMVAAIFMILARFKVVALLWSVNIIYWLIMLPLATCVFLSKKKVYINKYY